jgi:hypothetical protein
MRRVWLVLLAATVVLNTGAGFAVVGDSVTADSREELGARGADVFANGGVDIVTGRQAIRRLSREHRRRLVIELGLMDVGFWSNEADLRRRVRAVMRDDIDGIGCTIWVDLVTWSRRGQPSWPERAAAFNALLTDLADEYGVHVARWSVFAQRHRDWFRPDGIHPNARGQRGFAKYLDGRVDHFC